VGAQLVILVQRFPSRELIDDLNASYSNILESGCFEVSKALGEERRNEPELNDMPRIVCRFNRHAHGRLRSMIDRMNKDG
jgi:hypothetical protein